MVADPKHSATAASYDAVAEAYAETYYGELAQKPFDREVLTRFAADVTGTGRVADIGCGPGHVGRFLSDLGLELLGLDISPEMVTLARKLNPACRFEVGNMLALSLPDGALEGAVAFYSLIHLKRGEVVLALTELRRVLRPGSPLLVSFHIGNEVRHLDSWFEKPVSLAFTFFGTGEMTGYAEAAGFDVERVQVRSAYPFEVQTERAYMCLRSPPR